MIRSSPRLADDVAATNVATSDRPALQAHSADFAIFSALFAVAMLFHEGKWNYAWQNRLDVCLIATALLVLARPSSVPRAALMHAIVLATVIDRSPWISNHFLLAAMLSLTVLLALAQELAREARGLNPRALAARTYTAFAPAVRVEVILLYVCSVFHKLNTDFFDPQLSCAAHFYDAVVRRSYGLLPQGLVAAHCLAIYCTILVEMLIPILLIARPTRYAGLLLAAMFHLTLGVIEFGNFSAICLAALFTFTSTDQKPAPRRWLGSDRSGTVSWLLSGLIVTCAVGAIVSFDRWGSMPGVVAFNPEVDLLARNPARDVFHLLWLPFGTVAVVAALLIWRRGGVVDSIGRPGWLVGIAPVLVLVNGACPYLGLKTETSFSMFSNLRTEAGASNHLLVRRIVPLAAYQDDVVRIDSTSDVSHSRFVQPDMALAWFELRSYASRKTLAGEGDFAITYTRAGQTHEVSHASNDADLCRPQPWLTRKLLLFRPVKFGRANTCGH